MTTTLRLDARDDRVWARTVDALQASLAVRPSLVILCRSCGGKLASAGQTTVGPLFTSPFPVELSLSLVVTVGGRRLNRRETLRHERETSGLVNASGPPIEDKDIAGTIALLAVPAHLPQDYPDLLVRCHKHGDAVLDRLEVLDRMRRQPKVWKVDVSTPLHDFEPLRVGRGTATRSHETRRIRGDQMTLEEAAEWLGWSISAKPARARTLLE